MSEQTAAVAAASATVAPAQVASPAQEAVTPAVEAGNQPEAKVALPLASEAVTPEQAAERAQAAELEKGGWVDPSKGAVSFEKTGDAGLDVALDFIGRAGFTANHPAVQAAAQGEFSLLAAALAEKGVTGWEQHLNLAKEAQGRFAEQEKAKSAAIYDACLHAAGGDEKVWAETLEWASANAEPAEKEAINTALASGGVLAEAVSQWLVNSYRGAPGVTISPQASAVNAAVVAGAGAAAGNGPLSPAEYAREVAKIRQQGSIEGSREYAALQARRAMYRG
jgi:hypothetical protein